MPARINAILIALLAILVSSGCTKSENEPVNKTAVSSTAPTSNADEFVNETESEPDAEIDIKSVRLEQRKKFRTTGELESPVRLMADGEPIDIAILQEKSGGAAHAGPAIADVDGDGDCDLVVGDFPGYFWFFENQKDDANPSYVSKGKLQAGGVDANTPIY